MTRERIPPQHTRARKYVPRSGDLIRVEYKRHNNMLLSTHVYEVIEPTDGYDTWVRRLYSDNGCVMGDTFRLGQNWFYDPLHVWEVLSE